MITIHTSNVSSSWIPNAMYGGCFPECAEWGPLTPREQIEWCESLRGEHVITTCSEHVILYFLREVRRGFLRPEHLVIWLYGHGEPLRMRVDSDGEFIDSWPGGFWDERSELLFDD